MEKTTMRKQGGQWIVSSWDESVKCYRESSPMSYFAARTACGQDNCPGAHGGQCRNRDHRHDR